MAKIIETRELTGKVRLESGGESYDFRVYGDLRSGQSEWVMRLSCNIVSGTPPIIVRWCDEERLNPNKPEGAWTNELVETLGEIFHDALGGPVTMTNVVLLCST